jgi:hypothetical protein
VVVDQAFSSISARGNFVAFRKLLIVTLLPFLDVFLKNKNVATALIMDVGPQAKWSISDKRDFTTQGTMPTANGTNTYIAVDQLSVSDYGDDSKQTQQIDLLGRKDSACDSSFGSYQQNASTACDVASAASARGRDPKGPERKAIVLSSAFDWSSSEDEDAKSGLIRPFWRKKQNKEADTKAKGVKGTSKSKDPEGKNEKRKFSAKKMSFSLHGRKGGCVDKEV